MKNYEQDDAAYMIAHIEEHGEKVLAEEEAYHRQAILDAASTSRTTAPWIGPGGVLAPPDLKALVAEHGGYLNIPSEAWAAYYAKLDKWRMIVRTRQPN